MTRQALALLLLVIGSQNGFGQVFVEKIFPPALQRGRISRVVVSGSNLAGATSLWTSLGPQLKLTLATASTDQQAVFDVFVPHDAPLGLYGLRLATQNGLSNVHLFAIDDLPQAEEVEFSQPQLPNNEPATAQHIKLPVAVSAACGATDVDCFSFRVERGQRVSFEVVGSRLGKAFDPVISILDANGRFVVDRDNDVGLFFDCRFEHTFAEAGTYVAKVHDSRYHGSNHWTYSLRIGRFPVARVAFPSTVHPSEQSQVNFPQVEDTPRTFSFTAFKKQTAPFFFGLRRNQDEGSAWLPLSFSTLPNVIEVEPNDDRPQATTAVAPCNLHGIISKENDWDYFRLALKKGQKLKFCAQTRNIGSAADLELSLFGVDGKSLKQVDDSGYEDATFTFTPPADGNYVLQVGDVLRDGGSAFVYRIEVNAVQPHVELESEIGRIAVPQGTWQPLPLKLKRTQYDGPLELSLAGAPSGIRLRTTSIPANVNLLDGILDVDDTVPTGVYTLQIVASIKSTERTIQTNARTQPLIDRLPTGRGPHGEPFELREDQRRLPATLTDRIAIVVTPPAPFDFELPESEVLLPRYVFTHFPIKTRRSESYSEPIELVARGGQLEHDRLRQPKIIATIPAATTEQGTVMAKLSSVVDTATTRHRVTITATAKDGARTVNLTRVFYLDTRVAFQPTVEPSQLKLSPGQTAKVRVLANRLKPFDGAFTIRPSKVEDIQLPEEIVLAPGQTEVEVPIQIGPGIKPGKYSVELPAETRIAKFAEQASAGKLEIEITAAE